MTLHNFISRINWRQILIHFVAFWFFMHAFLTLSYLHDTKLIDLVRQSNEQPIEQIISQNKIGAEEITYFLVWTSISDFIGLLVAFIISLTISIKRNWFWVNSLLAFVFMLMFTRYHILGWNYVKPFFWYLGQKISNSTIEFLFNGMLLLTIGVLLFFSRRINRFIEANK